MAIPIEIITTITEHLIKDLGTPENVHSQTINVTLFGARYEKTSLTQLVKRLSHLSLVITIGNTN